MEPLSRNCTGKFLQTWSSWIMHNSLWLIQSNGKQKPNIWPPPQQSTESGHTPHKLWTVIFEGSNGNKWRWFIFSITHLFIGIQLSQKSERKQREKDVPTQRYQESEVPSPPHRWVQIMPLILMSWMSLGKLLDFSFSILVSYVSALVTIQ